MPEKSPSQRNAKASEKSAGVNTPEVPKVKPQAFTPPSSTPVRVSVNSWWCPVDDVSYQKNDTCSLNPSCSVDGCWSK